MTQAEDSLINMTPNGLGAQNFASAPSQSVLALKRSKYPSLQSRKSSQISFGCFLEVRALGDICLWGFWRVSEGSSPNQASLGGGELHF